MANKDLIGKTLTKGNFTGKVVHITDSQITMVNEHGYEKTFDIKKKKVVKDNKEVKQPVKDAEADLFPCLLLPLEDNEELVEDSAITDMPQQREGVTEIIYWKDPVTGETKKIYPKINGFFYVRPNGEQVMLNEKTDWAKAKSELVQAKKKDIEEGLYTKEQANQIEVQGIPAYKDLDYARENAGRFVIYAKRETTEKGNVKNSLNPSWEKYCAYAFTSGMTETNLQKGELSTYLASKKIVSLGLFDNLEDTRIAVNKYFELDSDYEAYKQIYGTNVDEWQVAYDKTFNVRGGKSGQSKIKNKVDNPRADTDAVINFRADAQFQNKRANYSLPINNRRNAQDRLSIGLKNQTLYSLANKMYPDQTNAIEIAELYNPNSQKDVVNQITSCKNALELFYIVKDFWLKVSNGYTDENGEEIEGTGIDLSELQCTIGGSEGDGTGTIDVRLKELGYEDKGRLGYYNPQTDTWHKKSISWQFGENVPQELVDMFS